MLVIEIALGIVLAAVILRFWQSILSFGLVVALGAALLSAASIGIYFVYTNIDSIAPFVGILILVLLLVGSVSLFDRVGEFVSSYTIKHWNLEGGDIASIIYINLMYMAGMFFLAKGVFSNEYLADGLMSAILLFTISYFSMRSVKKQINNSRVQREVRKSYSE